MKTISKKKLQKIANWLDVEINNNSGTIYFSYTTEHITCPELKEGEVIKPQEKWSYPIADHIPECGFVWFIHQYVPDWAKTEEPNWRKETTYVLPDPNNPDKPPKKNWRPK